MKNERGSFLKHDLASEVHPTKNSGLDLSRLTSGSGKKIWWVCSKDEKHEWESTIDSRTGRGFGCLICSGRKIVAGINDLSTRNPALALEWNYEKNPDVSIYEIAVNSSTKIWWKCDYGHEWLATVNSRNNAKKPSGCPYCSGRRAVAGVNDLMTLYPNIAIEWDEQKNHSFRLEEITYSSSRKLWWICPVGHSYCAKPNERTYKGFGCPYCSGQRVLAGFNDLQTTHPEIAKQWHHDKNVISSKEVSAGSNRKIWWEDEFGHVWEQKVQKRTRKDNLLGCPYCSGVKILVGFNDLGTLHPGLLQFWDFSKNTIKTHEISTGNKGKVWWKCTLGHSYQMSMHNKTFRLFNCPVCSGKHVQAGFNDIATTNPDMAKEWHPTKNGNFLPQQVSSGSDKKVWWLGDCGHDWLGAISNRTYLDAGCTICGVGKTERGMMEAFSRITGYTFISTRLRLNRRLRKRGVIQVDGLNEYLRIIVEYDGSYYHGPDNPEKKSYELKAEEDADTTESLLNAGYRVIRVRELSATHELKFISVCSENLNKLEDMGNLLQISHRINGKDKDSFDDTVRKAMEARPHWFHW